MEVCVSALASCNCQSELLSFTYAYDRAHTLKKNLGSEICLNILIAGNSGRMLGSNRKFKNAGAATVASLPFASVAVLLHARAPAGSAPAAYSWYSLQRSLRALATAAASTIPTRSEEVALREPRPDKVWCPCRSLLRMVGAVLCLASPKLAKLFCRRADLRRVAVVVARLVCIVTHAGFDRLVL